MFGLTCVPFDTPGEVYRSPMPFGPFDIGGRLLDSYRRHEVTTVVVLATDEECAEKAGRSLRAVYAAEGWEVIALPTPDFEPPARLGDASSEEALRVALERARDNVEAGRNVAVHCLAGMGRTGTFLGLLRRLLTRCDGETALRWVRQFVPFAAESHAQERLVRELPLPD